MHAAECDMRRGSSNVGQGSRLVRGRGVFEAQLHGLAATPMVDVEPPRKVKARTAMLFERCTERPVEGTKGDSVELSRQTVAKAQFQVRLADPFGKADAHVREHIARAKRVGESHLK